MIYFLIILIGVVAGVAGGMGMGGGTLLVPLLAFLKIPQHDIQAINLISFLPMSVIALLIHRKNKLVRPKKTLWIIAPAVLTAVLGALLAGRTNERVLRTVFGVFLVAFGVWQSVWALVIKKASAKDKTEHESGKVEHEKTEHEKTEHESDKVDHGNHHGK